MKNLIFIILASMTAGGETIDLVTVRTAYESAATRRFGLTNLKQVLTTASGNLVITCYNGGAEMMEAKYAINPINKLSAFGLGKQLIENGIAADSDNVERRFVRYNIQRNLPALLNYRDRLKADITLIVNRRDTLKDRDMKDRILKFIKHDRS